MFCQILIPALITDTGAGRNSLVEHLFMVWRVVRSILPDGPIELFLVLVSAAVGLIKAVVCKCRLSGM